MKFYNYINEENDDEIDYKKFHSERRKTKISLKKELINLDNDIDKYIEKLEDEIDEMDDNPTFKYKLSQMLANMQKEYGEFILALRQIVNTLGSGIQIIPKERGHAKGAIPDENPFEPNLNNPAKVIAAKTKSNQKTS